MAPRALFEWRSSRSAITSLDEAAPTALANKCSAKRRVRISASAMRSTGWPLCFAATVEETPPPSTQELTVLRDLQIRTARAHGGEAAPHA